MAIPQKDTVFITGGSSGIGEGLAKAFYQRGAKVIIGGRDEATLARVASQHKGMETCVIDVSNADSVMQCARSIGERFPNLNMVVNNAGIQRFVDFTGAVLSAEDIDPEIDTNLKGLMYVSNAFLPVLRRQSSAKLVHVSSGLGFVPLVKAPIYSATKAAVHMFTIALREQLRSTSVQVIELIPPLVETNLHRDLPSMPSGAMALDAFIAKTMQALDSGKDELPIGLARMLKIGSRIMPNRFLKIVNGSQ